MHSIDPIHAIALTERCPLKRLPPHLQYCQRQMMPVGAEAVANTSDVINRWKEKCFQE